MRAAAPSNSPSLGTGGGPMAAGPAKTTAAAAGVAKWPGGAVRVGNAHGNGGVAAGWRARRPRTAASRRGTHVWVYERPGGGVGSAHVGRGRRKGGGGRRAHLPRGARAHADPKTAAAHLEKRIAAGGARRRGARHCQGAAAVRDGGRVERPARGQGRLPLRGGDALQRLLRHPAPPPPPQGVGRGGVGERETLGIRPNGRGCHSTSIWWRGRVLYGVSRCSPHRRPLQPTGCMHAFWTSASHVSPSMQLPKKESAESTARVCTERGSIGARHRQRRGIKASDGRPCPRSCCSEPASRPRTAAAAAAVPQQEPAPGCGT